MNIEVQHRWIYYIGGCNLYFCTIRCEKLQNFKEVKDTPTTDIRYLENGRFEIQAEIDAESEH